MYYEKEYADMLTACAPAEDEVRSKAHFTQERITHHQRTARRNRIRTFRRNLIESIQTENRHVIRMVSGKGDSNLLIALPLNRFSFTLTKSEFEDGLCIRYNIGLKHAQ